MLSGDPDGIPAVPPIARAEEWIKTTGLYFDRESEIVEELFDPRRGMLRKVELDEEERNRLLALWRGRRGLAVHLEREQEERLRSWAETRAKRKEIEHLDEVLRKQMKERRNGR